MKATIKQLDIAAKKYHQEIKQRSDNAAIIAWCELHGWDSSDAETQRLLARQAVLNAVIRKAFPDLTLCRTPFDIDADLRIIKDQVVIYRQER